MSEPQIKAALQKGIRAARRGRVEPARQLLAQVIQAEPDNEEAWLWMSRVVDDPAQRTECLNKVLELNPDNRWAADQLAELQAEAQAPPSIPTGETAPEPTTAPPPLPADSKYKRLQQKSEIKLETLKCPNCGGSVEIQGGSAVKTLICNYCGSVLDLTEEQAAIIGQIDVRIKPAVPIKPGMEGTFKGEVHQVIGWMRYEGWDDEDRWRWDEWLLASAGGQFKWLSYDPEAGFILQEKILPLSPFNPKTATSIEVPGGMAQVTERSPARIIALNGELTWQGTVGDRVFYLEARRGKARYSVEYTDEEIELLAGEELSAAEVWTAFGRDDLVKKAEQETQWNTVYKVLAAFCIIFALCGCFGALGTGAMGEQLATHQVQVSVGEGGAQSVGPIDIKQPGRVHRISLQAGGLPVNNWAVVDVTVYDGEDNEFYLFSEEFWDEEGRDSDGYWHESDMSGSYLFKPDTPGQYVLELSMEEATVSSVPVTVTVAQGVWLSRYFVIFTVICLVLAFIFGSLGVKRLIGSSLIQSD